MYQWMTVSAYKYMLVLAYLCIRYVSVWIYVSVYKNPPHCNRQRMQKQNVSWELKMCINVWLYQPINICLYWRIYVCMYQLEYSSNPIYYRKQSYRFCTIIGLNFCIKKTTLLLYHYIITFTLHQESNIKLWRSIQNYFSRYQSSYDFFHEA